MPGKNIGSHDIL